MFVWAMLLGEEIDQGVHVDKSQTLLDDFAQSLPTMYSEKAMTMKVHELRLHITLFVKASGPLWVFSCFPYENANGHLPGLVHGTFDTLPQRFVAQIFVLIYSFFITVSIGGGIMGISFTQGMVCHRSDIQRHIQQQSLPPETLAFVNKMAGNKERSNVAAVEEGIEVLGAETKKHYQFTRGWH
ncbi:unnamed protein product [Porites lobata]|uniref:Uncharacterized protein n=1 Tax=Porites lobata TaxID=104759 RepID=A0ABN8PEZ6_9CNID|nr:unnamed protein product [Porites lobata]